MYLPSKKTKYIVLILAASFLIASAVGGIVQETITSFSQALIAFSKIPRQEKINRLEDKNISLRLKLKKYESLARENAILREALDFKKSDALEMTGAEIIAFSPSSWHKYIFIDAGSDKGLEKNMLVIDKKGNLIGKVQKAGGKKSRVIMIENPDFQIPVSVEKQEFGLLQGNLSGAKILYIENRDKIAPGDKVYTAVSDHTSVIGVGRIAKITKTGGNLFCEIEVDIFAKGRPPRIVFVVK